MPLKSLVLSSKSQHILHFIHSVGHFSSKTGFKRLTFKNTAGLGKVGGVATALISREQSSLPQTRRAAWGSQPVTSHHLAGPGTGPGSGAQASRGGPAGGGRRNGPAAVNPRGPCRDTWGGLERDPLDSAVASGPPPASIALDLLSYFSPPLSLLQLPGCASDSQACCCLRALAQAGPGWGRGVLLTAAPSTPSRSLDSSRSAPPAHLPRPSH